jgi:cellulose synthase/poly-beta-1,6-N-acetylglucosamine synthase-like glycosyltransferase
MCSCKHINAAGEDRWLCTLLLKRGYLVEYSAASDVYTQCPESFDEFYKQRRRWIPSTMANIMDLLMNYKPIVKINDNISRIYIFYQVCRFIYINRVISQNRLWFQLSRQRRYMHAFAYK